MAPQNSPDIPLFKRFKAVWEDVGKDDNYSGLEIQEQLQDLQQATVQFLKQDDVTEQVRDDNKELIELTLLVLERSPEKIHWRTPGALHRARWMATLIYTFKIYLFRHQNVVRLAKKEETQLSRFVQFGALIYTKA